MVNIIVSVIFGLVEGISEWLPISSTGHLIILDEFLSLDVSPEFYKIYEVVIQLGAALAVLVVFWKTIWPFGKSDEPLGKGILSICKKDKFIMWLKIAVACIPPVIAGLTIVDFCDAHFYNPLCVSLALIVVGAAFIVVESINKNKKPKITDISEFSFGTAFLIGLFQVLAAVFPGTSRSGATIIGALIMGISRQAASEFTFFMSIPVMFGASILKIFKYGFSVGAYELLILAVGSITAFVVSIFVLNFLIAYVKKHDFKIFGYYRIILGILVLLLVR